MSDLSSAYQIIDDITTLDLSLRGAINKLYSAARSKAGMPLSQQATEALIQTVKPGDVVFFLTGLLVRAAFTPDIAESDGPVGIVVLAYSMQRALGITPVLVADASMEEKLEAAMRSGGFSRIPMETLQGACAPSKRPTRAFGIVTMPEDQQGGESVAKELIDTYRPAAIISCERGAPNRFGVIHNAQGLNISKYHCRADLLFKTAFEMDGGAVTIGIGDGGNEVGMGKIEEDLLTWLPYGDKCQCGCGGGVIPETDCDVLISSTVSNWGASGLAAAIAMATGKSEALCDAEYHKKVIEGCAMAGFIDSPTGEAVTRIDGMDMPVHLAIADLLTQVAKGVIAGGGALWDKK